MSTVEMQITKKIFWKLEIGNGDKICVCIHICATAFILRITSVILYILYLIIIIIIIITIIII
jgi:hypothetical protein